MAQPQQVYPLNIPSISVLHPGIPADVVQFLHLNDNIANGDPINIVNAKQAEGVVTSLEHLQSEYIIHRLLAYVLIQFTTTSTPGSHYTASS